MTTMNNLRKRVAACDLEKRPRTSVKIEEPPVNQPLQVYICDLFISSSKHFVKQLFEILKFFICQKCSSEEELEQNNFTLELLCWSNEYRARHNAPPLLVSKEVRIILFNQFHYDLCRKASNKSYLIFVRIILFNISCDGSFAMLRKSSPII